MAPRIRAFTREQTRDPAIIEHRRNTATAFLAAALYRPAGYGHTNGSQGELQWAGEETEISAVGILAPFAEC